VKLCLCLRSASYLLPVAFIVVCKALPIQASVLFYLFGRVWSCNLQIVTSKMHEFSQERFTGPQGAWIRYANLLMSSNAAFNTKVTLLDAVQVAERLSSHNCLLVSQCVVLVIEQ